jgi:hypothetical protein
LLIRSRPRPPPCGRRRQKRSRVKEKAYTYCNFYKWIRNSQGSVARAAGGPEGPHASSKGSPSAIARSCGKTVPTGLSSPPAAEDDPIDGLSSVILFIYTFWLYVPFKPKTVPKALRRWALRRQSHIRDSNLHSAAPLRGGGDSAPKGVLQSIQIGRQRDLRFIILLVLTKQFS